ncbi:TPA: hypothetical protein KNH08_003560 [Serratia fonticola]|nr:hypothetical protein [Serratia fonticola]
MSAKNEDINIIMEQESVQKTRMTIPDSSSSLPPNVSAEPYSFIAKIKSYLIKRHLLSEDTENIGDCLFILIPNESKRDIEEFGRGVTRFFTSSTINIKGKVILSLDSNLSRVRIIETNYHECKDDVDVINLFSSEVDKISGHTSTPLCYAIYEHKSNIITSYPDGEDGIEDCYKVETNKIVYSCSDLENHAHDFYVKELKYPSAGMVIWDNAKDYALAKKTEDRISARLTISLREKLGSENVIQEPIVTSGRIDILIHSTAMTHQQGPCIIELKVLRNSESAVHHRKWLCKGVLQARDYANDKNANSKYLMSYDGREKNVKIDVVDSLAKKYAVKYINYRMYNATAAPREDEVNELLE